MLQCDTPLLPFGWWSSCRSPRTPTTHLWKPKINIQSIQELITQLDAEQSWFIIFPYSAVLGVLASLPEQLILWQKSSSVQRLCCEGIRIADSRSEVCTTGARKKPENSDSSLHQLWGYLRVAEMKPGRFIVTNGICWAPSRWSELDLPDEQPLRLVV